MFWRRSNLGQRVGPGGSGRAGSVSRGSSRVLGLTLAGLLILSACAAREEVVVIDHGDEESEDGHAAYTPVGRSGSPRVHADGDHKLADDVEIGPGGDDHGAPYVPVALGGSLLVVPGGEYKLAAPVLIGLERVAATPGSSYSSATSTPATVASSAGQKPATKPGAAAQAAPSPTPPARLNLGPSLGASASGAAPASNMLAMAEEDEEIGTVSGRIEGIIGNVMTVRTDTGQARVQIENGARIDRDTPGTAADLKPGQFVGVLQLPSGPAISVRLYNTGPTMPAPGIIPMVGSRIGQVTTFGRIVALQFGGMLMNTGVQTTTVTIPSNVEILKPAPGTMADVGVGAQIIATGPLAGDGTVNATSIRVTAAAPRVAPGASPPAAPRRS